MGSRIEELLVPALEEIQYVLTSTEHPIDEVVDRYETVMYETLEAHCDVHVPRVQEHPQCARQNRRNRRERKAKELEKNSLKRMCKKAARDGDSLHERKQLSRQWRNATKARRKLRIEREL